MTKPVPSFDELRLDDEPAGSPSSADAPTPPVDALTAAASLDDGSSALPGTGAFGSDSVDAGALATTGDPFGGMSLGGPVARPPEAGARRDKPPTTPIAQLRPPGQPALALPPPEPAHPPEIPPGREMVSSALTGLVGAALAIVVAVVAAISDDAYAAWLGLAPSDDIVATRVVSGLYDTASGKPVFFVRGRVENRGKKVRGPVRVTAELIAEGVAEAHAESIAGAEPSPEDVWSLRSTAEADKLKRALETAQAERKLPPGSSLPFFAVISDPPADPQHYRLHVKVESVDAWVPPSRKRGR